MTQLRSRLTRTDYVLLASIALCTAIIYATVPLVPVLRKALVERYGTGVYDLVYCLLGVGGLSLLVYALRKLRGRALVATLGTMGLVALVYALYLPRLHYAVEKVHFLEYGVLGVLLYLAAHRLWGGWSALCVAAAAAYWIGLGDELIQKILPSRVGEIRDSLINLVSAVLGMAAVVPAAGNPGRQARPALAQLRAVLVLLSVSTVLTTAFLFHVHGFGSAIGRPDSVVLFTALTPRDLDALNGPAVDSVSSAKLKLYRREAARHLLQREFYLTNEFVASDGTRYKQWWRSWYENKILETWYPQYLQKHRDDSSSTHLRPIDSRLAGKVRDLRVVWPDSLLMSVKLQSDTSAPYVSRVNETMIRSFSPATALLVSAALLLVFAALFVPCSGNRRRRTEDRAGPASGIPTGQSNSHT